MLITIIRLWGKVNNGEKMAEIISMSLDEKTLQDLDHLQKELGFSGRSETIRQCIRVFASERKQSTKLKGEMDGVVVV